MVSEQTILDHIAGLVADVLNEDRAATAREKLELLAFGFCTMLDGCTGEIGCRLHATDDGETYSPNLAGRLHEGIHAAIRRALANPKNKE